MAPLRAMLEAVAVAIAAAVAADAVAVAVTAAAVTSSVDVFQIFLLVSGAIAAYRQIVGPDRGRLG
jgi:hypothetical protein